MDERRLIDAMTGGIEPAEKVKAFAPQIVVSGTPGTPYYNISWYDVVKRGWYMGYGSYNIEFVRKWLCECIEEVEADMVEVVRCKDCKHRNRYYCYHPEQMYLAVDIDYYCARGERRES